MDVYNIWTDIRLIIILLLRWCVFLNVCKKKTRPKKLFLNKIIIIITIRLDELEILPDNTIMK